MRCLLIVAIVTVGVVAVHGAANSVLMKLLMQLEKRNVSWLDVLIVPIYPSYMKNLKYKEKFSVFLMAKSCNI